MGRGRHVAYSAGWKKFEPAWDAVIRMRRLAGALPVLEGVLSGLGRVRPDATVEGRSVVDGQAHEDGQLVRWVPTSRRSSDPSAATTAVAG